jgi:hypothetical protein
MTNKLDQVRCVLWKRRLAKTVRVLVIGEAGSGKSRVASELVMREFKERPVQEAQVVEVEYDLEHRGHLLQVTKHSKRGQCVVCE